LEAVWTIKFIQNSISYITKEFKIKNSNSDGGEYLHRISIKSEDKYGRWTGDGFLSFSPKGTRFWMRPAIGNISFTTECSFLTNSEAVGDLIATKTAIRTQANSLLEDTNK
jgi:hypothetical protein